MVGYKEFRGRLGTGETKRRTHRRRRVYRYRNNEDGPEKLGAILAACPVDDPVERADRGGFGSPGRRLAARMLTISKGSRRRKQITAGKLPGHGEGRVSPSDVVNEGQQGV